FATCDVWCIHQCEIVNCVDYYLTIIAVFYTVFNQTDLTFSYHLITENKTWYEAQSYCRKNYTDLVSIRDQEQNEAVKIAGMNSSDSFWIGLLRDDWEWADGGRSAYRNWDTGSPRKSSTSSNCTQLNRGKWQTVPCSNHVAAVLCYNSTS
uniref:C-type lectin domain-containing protein n=1 Tax=Astyanax mexicanus TaxID=7994 RepID=A0A8B9JJ97_ASTMX